MPSDRQRYEREIASLRNETGDSINRGRGMADRYGDYLGADREQRINRTEPLFDRYGGALDRTSRYGGMGEGAFGAIDPQYQGYADWGRADVAGLEGGYSPEALASMRGAAIDSVPGRYDAAARQLRLNQTRRGGGGGAPAGGDYSREFGGLYAAREQERAGALRSITLGDEDRRRENILANRQYGLQRRGVGMQALDARSRNAGLYANLGAAYTGDIAGAAGQISSTYNPAPYIGGQTSLYGTEADLTRTRGQFIAPEKGPGFWSRLRDSAVGAGLNVGISYLTGGAAGGGGGGGGGWSPVDPN